MNNTEQIEPNLLMRAATPRVPHPTDAQLPWTFESLPHFQPIGPTRWTSERKAGGSAKRGLGSFRQKAGYLVDWEGWRLGVGPLLPASDTHTDGSIWDNILNYPGWLLQGGGCDASSPAFGAN